MIRRVREWSTMKQVLAGVALVFGLIASVWAAHEHVLGTARFVADERIELHEAISEAKVEQRLFVIERQQAVSDTKLDMLLRAQGLEVPSGP